MLHLSNANLFSWLILYATSLMVVHNGQLNKVEILYTEKRFAQNHKLVFVLNYFSDLKSIILCLF